MTLLGGIAAGGLSPACPIGPRARFQCDHRGSGTGGPLAVFAIPAVRADPLLASGGGSPAAFPDTRWPGRAVGIISSPQPRQHDRAGLVLGVLSEQLAAEGR